MITPYLLDKGLHMKISTRVKQILSYYESDSPGVKSKLCQILMHGKLQGTGHMVILPVDQGFEHGPDRSFSVNPDAYHPHYHYQLAIDAGLSAYAAPLGMLEAGADSFVGAIPTILKMNSANSLYPKDNDPFQAITASIQDALRLGCSGIGFTIYPGSENSYKMIEEVRELSKEAKNYGLCVVIWSYARGKDLSKQGETAIDVACYSAHIAALIGAHIIKVKIPSAYIEQKENQEIYKKYNWHIDHLESRIHHVTQSAFNNRRLVVFSGGASTNEDDIYTQVQAIKKGGGAGSIIGRNSFQRSRPQALAMLEKIIDIYKTPL